MYTIDSQGKKLGRVASEAACILMGKHNPSFQRHLVSGEEVEIINSSRLSLDSKKKKSKAYVSYTGYPGGLRTKTMEQIISKKGYTEILRKAVYGMLPPNKLRKVRMKKLKIS
jgi:large subunit ribosomal protein L13